MHDLITCTHTYLSSFLNNRLVRSKIRLTHGRLLIEAASEDSSKQNVAAFGRAPALILNEFLLVVVAAATVQVFLCQLAALIVAAAGLPRGAQSAS
jgi:hypothetical protein